MRNKYFSPDSGRFVGGLLVVIFAIVLVFALQSCVTEKRCREKFPIAEIEVSRQTDTSKVANKNAALVDSLLNAFRPCPEWDFLPYSIDTVYIDSAAKAAKVFNKKVVTANMMNDQIKRALSAPCKDSTLLIYTSVYKSRYSKHAEEALQALERKNASTAWHLYRIVCLNWFWILVIVLLAVGFVIANNKNWLPW